MLAAFKTCHSARWFAALAAAVPKAVGDRAAGLRASKPNGLAGPENSLDFYASIRSLYRQRRAPEMWIEEGPVTSC